MFFEIDSVSFQNREKVNSNKTSYNFAFQPLDLCYCSVMMLLHINLLCCSVSATVFIQITVYTIFACIWADYASIFSKN